MSNDSSYLSGEFRGLDPANAYAQRLNRLERRRRLLQAILFLSTIASTTMVGGWAYGLTVIAILLCHEMGHYFAARYYHVPTTLPYFLPFPFSLFGTFGAVIKMQGIIPNRKALFDIGIMGPALGLVIAIPATIYGIIHSQVGPITDHSIQLGDSLLMRWLIAWLRGPMPQGQDLLLHPVGFAGWAGLFVTALNLLPIGQLDGGHIIYAMFYKRAALVYRTLFIAFAIFTALMNPQWLFFLVMLLFLIKLKHPPTLEDQPPLGTTRIIFGIVALIFFLITFTPIPVQLSH